VTGVRDPYRTASFNDAVFGQSGAAPAIERVGADLWGGTHQFGAIHRAGAFGAAPTVTVRVASQDGTGGWTRAGAVVRNDLSADGSHAPAPSARARPTPTAPPGPPSARPLRAAPPTPGTRRSSWRRRTAGPPPVGSRSSRTSPSI